MSRGSRRDRIPTRMYRVRVEKGLTQAELGARIGSPGAVISQRECRLKPAGPALRERIARALDVPAAELFDEVGFAIPERSLPRFRPNALEKEVVRLTRRGWSRPAINEELGLKGYDIWKIQRDAGLFPLSRGGGRP